MRPALPVGAPITISRGGAVIADVLDDFPAAHSLRLKEIRTQLGSEGHGHIVPRLDGTLMRCGGPGICKTCQKEGLLLDIWQEAVDVKALTPVSATPGIFDLITGTASQATGPAFAQAARVPDRAGGCRSPRARA
jgi:NAD-dependent DNA ligase